MTCRDVAIHSEVFVTLPTNSQPTKCEVVDYDPELNEFEVKVFGAWRLHQNWWVPCEDITLPQKQKRGTLK